jgi:hypothetical protein
LSTIEPADFFAATMSMAASRNSVETIDRWYRLAGLTLHIRFLGDGLLRVITPALEHCLVEASTNCADLTLVCWDCEGLGLPYPQSPVSKQAFIPRGDVVEFCTTRYLTAFETGGRLLSMMDIQEGCAFYCVGSAREVPRFEVAEPIRVLLSWFMRAHRRQLVHAAAVGHSDGGVLLVGRSGAGKSNSSLTCLHAGMGFVSDDFCAISVDKAPMAHSLYSTAKTLNSDSQRSPFLTGLVSEPDPTGRDKTIYLLNRAAPDRLLAGFPLKAILLLEKCEGPTLFLPVSAGSVLSAWAPDTARLLANAGAEVLRTLGRLVRSLPCYKLRLGSDPSAIAPAIDDLLRKNGHAS